jgi:guanylate kinase
MNEGSLERVPFLIVISGPSGAGKSSIAMRVLERNPDIYYSVSFTTRPIRGTEEEGIDYFFTTKNDFREKIEKQEFIEWAHVHGAYYGTPKTPILEAFAKGRKALLDIDVQGGSQIREKFARGVSIFILPPTWEELVDRLRGRKTDKAEVIERRLRQASREVEELKNYYYLVLNSDLEEAVIRVEEIIRAEECRVDRIEGTETWAKSAAS